MYKSIIFSKVICIYLCFLFPASILAAPPKVLVVMSYEQDNPWCREIKEGIDSILPENSETAYFYMDTKVNPEGGRQKAQEAYELFQKFQPDGIITVDDNAQKAFVLPYLSNKVDIPVMFAGVNAQPEKYGYPSANVSGILERGHIRESIAFAKQLVPGIGSVAFIAKESPSGRALLKQVNDESSTFPAQFHSFNLVKNARELTALGETLKKQTDAVYIDSLNGIEDEEGNPLSHEGAMQVLMSVYGKPVIGANLYHVKQGALCSVIKSGQEQGETAAEMLLKAMQGTPVSNIPLTRNHKGKRVINVTTMKSLGIKPRAIVLLGTQLIN